MLSTHEELPGEIFSALCSELAEPPYCLKEGLVVMDKLLADPAIHLKADISKQYGFLQANLNHLNPEVKRMTRAAMGYTILKIQDPKLADLFRNVIQLDKAEIKLPDRFVLNNKGYRALCSLISCLTEQTAVTMDSYIISLKYSILQFSMLYNALAKSKVNCIHILVEDAFGRFPRFSQPCFQIICNFIASAPNLKKL